MCLENRRGHCTFQTNEPWDECKEEATQHGSEQPGLLSPHPRQQEGALQPQEATGQDSWVAACLTRLESFSRASSVLNTWFWVFSS